jgi:hypothetical protein
MDAQILSVQSKAIYAVLIEHQPAKIRLEISAKVTLNL